LNRFQTSVPTSRVVLKDWRAGYRFVCSDTRRRPSDSSSSRSRLIVGGAFLLSHCCCLSLSTSKLSVHPLRCRRLLYQLASISCSGASAFVFHGVVQAARTITMPLSPKMRRGPLAPSTSLSDTEQMSHVGVPCVHLRVPCESAVHSQRVRETLCKGR